MPRYLTSACCGIESTFSAVSVGICGVHTRGGERGGLSLKADLDQLENREIRVPSINRSYSLSILLTVLARLSSSATALKSSVTPQSPSSAAAEGEEEEERTRDETRAEWSAATAASGSLAASAVETTANGVVVVAGGAAAAAEASITAGSSRLSCWEMAAILFCLARSCFLFWKGLPLEDDLEKM